MSNSNSISSMNSTSVSTTNKSSKSTKAPILENTNVIVNFSYEYSHKSKKIRISKGEILQLLQQTNEHWWKCLRSDQTKSFYVPATYVSVIEDGDEDDVEEEDEPASIKKIDVSNNSNNGSLDDLLERRSNFSETHCDTDYDEAPQVFHNYSNNRQHLQPMFLKVDDNQSLSSIPSSVVTLSNEQLAAIPGGNGGVRGGDYGGGLSSFRGSSNSVKQHSTSSNNNNKNSSCSSISSKTKLNKDPYWSNSLEELAKQIVFPGQSSIYFNNPAFKPDSPSFKADSSLNQRTPPPSLSFSSDFDNESTTELNSSHEGNSSVHLEKGGGGGSGSCTTDDENNTNEPPRPEDFVRTISNNWSEYKCRNSDRIFYYNSKTKGRSWKPPRISKEESNNNVFQVPPGWTQKVDDLNGTASFVNQTTGSKQLKCKEAQGVMENISLEASRLLDSILEQTQWYCATDPQGKVYFYEENSSKSSWFLPVTENAGQSSGGRPTSCMPGHQLHESISSDSSEVEDLTKVQKRHSTGDYVLDRNFKSQSVFVFDERSKLDVSKSDSLSRQRLSIWKNGKLPVFHENYLTRTKYTENHKKVRKNWTTSWAVLTATHLSFFKDQKFLNAAVVKSELEVDLQHSRVEECPDRGKSSRKNVFLITCPTFELLCQSNNTSEYELWFEKVQEVINELKPADDIVRYRGNTSDFLDTHSSGSTVKRKSTIKSSTKVKITSTSDDEEKNNIRSTLRRFFQKGRPHKDALVKKGIYKDEPVFGCLLEKLIATDKTPIPKFVDRCINVIESRDENMKTDGIYRASGNLSQVQKIRCQVDQDNFAVLDNEDDVHVLAGALKLFFREMREPILPSKLFDRFLSACQLHRREEKLSEFKSLVEKLPKENYLTLKRLLTHLLKVSQYSEYNRMQIPNLAIVFGPTLMWNSCESTNMAIDLMQQNYVVEILLQEFHTFFS